MFQIRSKMLYSYVIKSFVVFKEYSNIEGIFLATCVSDLQH